MLLRSLQEFAIRNCSNVAEEFSNVAEEFAIGNCSNVAEEFATGKLFRALCREKCSAKLCRERRL